MSADFYRIQEHGRRCRLTVEGSTIYLTHEDGTGRRQRSARVFLRYPPESKVWQWLRSKGIRRPSPSGRSLPTAERGKDTRPPPLRLPADAEAALAELVKVSGASRLATASAAILACARGGAVRDLYLNELAQLRLERAVLLLDLEKLRTAVKSLLRVQDGMPIEEAISVVQSVQHAIHQLGLKP